MAIVFQGQNIEVDERGYLLDGMQWSKPLAEYIAAKDGLALSDEHWRVMDFLRDYHAQFDIEPPMRLLVKQLTALWGAELGSSRALYKLFAQGPVKQASRYAGLPRPLSCI